MLHLSVDDGQRLICGNPVGDGRKSLIFQTIQVYLSTCKIWILCSFYYSTAPVACKGGVPAMPGVIVRDGESFEKALRRFSKIIEKEGILSEVKKNQFYEKPSERKKRRLNSARRKQLIKSQDERNR
jgi:small subunit ribosomal protein S21